MDEAALLAAARAARERAYAPYSGFAVGAALLAADGTVVTGANVENASSGLAMCAERVALGAAVAAGHRHFLAVAVAAGGPRPVTPCGACRQVLHELPAGPDLEVICTSTSTGETLRRRLGELLPAAFTREAGGRP